MGSFLIGGLLNRPNSLKTLVTTTLKLVDHFVLSTLHAAGNMQRKTINNCSAVQWTRTFYVSSMTANLINGLSVTVSLFYHIILQLWTSRTH